MNSKHLELVIFIWLIQIINSLLKRLYLMFLSGQLLQYAAWQPTTNILVAYGNKHFLLTCLRVDYRLDHLG